MIEKLISDYEKNEFKSKALQKRKEKQEKARAELEKDVYDNATPMTADEVAAYRKRPCANHVKKLVCSIRS